MGLQDGGCRVEGAGWGALRGTRMGVMGMENMEIGSMDVWSTGTGDARLGVWGWGP